MQEYKVSVAIKFALKRKERTTMTKTQEKYKINRIKINQNRIYYILPIKQYKKVMNKHKRETGKETVLKTQNNPIPHGETT